MVVYLDGVLASSAAVPVFVRKYMVPIRRTQVVSSLHELLQLDVIS